MGLCRQTTLEKDSRERAAFRSGVQQLHLCTCSLQRGCYFLYTQPAKGCYFLYTQPTRGCLQRGCYFLYTQPAKGCYFLYTQPTRGCLQRGCYFLYTQPAKGCYFLYTQPTKGVLLSLHTAYKGGATFFTRSLQRGCYLFFHPHTLFRHLASFHLASFATSLHAASTSPLLPPRYTQPTRGCYFLFPPTHTHSVNKMVTFSWELARCETEGAGAPVSAPG